MRWYALVSLAVLLSARPAGASQLSCDAPRLFAQVRNAAGGARWNAIKEVVAQGTMVDSGARGSVYFARDTLTGRSAFVESLDQARVAFFFDGSSKWERDQGGGLHPIDAADSIARAITNAYLDRNGFWNPQRDPATFTCMPRRSALKHTFDVIRVLPQRGSGADIWIDRSTHLIDRVVQQLPTTTSTLYYADYRAVGGAVLPFSVTNGYTDAYGAPAGTEQRYARYELLRAVRPADFKRPEGPHDWRMIHGAHSTRIRIFVDKGVIVFNAMVNGKGPFAFVFDPGAQGVLTSEAAGPLGLTRGAMADVASVRVGDASIAHLPLPVYAGKPTDLYPERDPKRAPIAGALGPELLDRFAVRLDYGRATMTLTPLKAFVYDARGAAVRFTMQEDDDIPLILASVDGKVGRFQYDVRAPVSVLLFAPYLEKTGLGARYPSGRGKVRALSLAGTTLRDVPATFGKQRVGKFSSRTEAGLLGYRVLSKYVTTINYATRTIYFEPR